MIKRALIVFPTLLILLTILNPKVPIAILMFLGVVLASAAVLLAIIWVFDPECIKLVYHETRNMFKEDLEH